MLVPDDLTDCFDIQSIFPTLDVQARCWLSPNIEHTNSRLVMRKLCENAPNVAEMSNRRLTDLPGVYVWMFSNNDAGPCDLRFLHCGKSVSLMRNRVRAHIRHAYDTTDSVYVLKGNKLEEICKPRASRNEQQIGEALQTVRVLFIAIFGEDASEAIPLLEAALTYAAEDEFGIGQTSNTMEKLHRDDALVKPAWAAYKEAIKRLQAG